MGAIANLMVQPYGAIIIGSMAGLFSCYGYRVLQVDVQGFPWGLLSDILFFCTELVVQQRFFFLQSGIQNVLNVHDSCGVHNLHGIPGVLSALLSVLFAGIASEKEYGERYIDLIK